jgi:hypothetical protein
LEAIFEAILNISGMLAWPDIHIKVKGDLAILMGDAVPQPPWDLPLYGLPDGDGKRGHQ